MPERFLRIINTNGNVAFETHLAPGADVFLQRADFNEDGPQTFSVVMTSEAAQSALVDLGVDAPAVEPFDVAALIEERDRLAAKLARAKSIKPVTVAGVTISGRGSRRVVSVSGSDGSVMFEGPA
ncbi:MAG: hypothetical protein ACT4PO_14380 [Actinomycetota bacterium]